MRETTVSLYRPENAATPLAKGIRVQVDQVSAREVVDLRMASNWQAGDYFKIYTQGWYYVSLLQRGDVLIDEQDSDPSAQSGQFFKFRVVGRVKNFEFDHQEAYVEVKVGN